VANRMAVSRRSVSRGLIHAVFSSMAVLVMLALAGPNPSAQASNGKGSGFLGAWCAQGDPSKHASISSNEAYFNLTNENGKTSMGNLTSPNQISAPGWQFVTGTLSHNGGRIDWSNGTFWARCSKGGGGGGVGGGMECWRRRRCYHDLHATVTTHVGSASVDIQVALDQQLRER